MQLARLTTKLAGAGLSAIAACSIASAEDMPGEGVTVRPAASTIAEENFQVELVARGLKELGYDVEPASELQVQLAIVAVGSGDLDYYSSYWDPLHTEFAKEAGGEDALQAQSELVEGYSLQGYLIDKKTATEHGIKDLTQLKDPKIAALFDIDGDGKADLYGCEPGWGCERAIVHHLEVYGLNDTIAQQQGSYFAIIPDAIERIKAGKPTLYYTWTPLWVSAVLRPGEEVSWLTVPKDPSADEAATAAATVEGIGNMGFPKNTQHVIANAEFLEDNPAAKAWFNRIKIPLEDINAQNLKMQQGEKTPADIQRHADEWIAAHRQQWDGWLAAARKAAS
jgi:glycine betaine/proline transport system substrate-binding protein